MTTPNPIPDAEELRKLCVRIIEYANAENRFIRDQWYETILARALLQRLDAESATEIDEYERRDALVVSICRAVCEVDGTDPDEPEQEYESAVHAYRDGPPKFVRYYDAVDKALDAAWSAAQRSGAVEEPNSIVYYFGLLKDGLRNRISRFVEHNSWNGDTEGGFCSTDEFDFDKLCTEIDKLGEEIRAAAPTPEGTK